MSKIEKVFSKIIAPINSKIRNKCSSTNDDYKYYKNFNFENHLKSMLFLQLSGASSLRELDVQYKNHSKIKEEFEMPSYSQLSRLNASKSLDNFKYLFDYVLSIAQKEIKSKINLGKFKDFKIIDSSVISISKNLSPSLYYENKTSAVRLSTLYSYGTELPSKMTIVPAKVGERNCIDNYVSDSSAIYIFDKGYSKYSWYDEMTKNNMKFITRLMANAQTEQHDCRQTGIENIYDLTVTLGTDYSKNKTKYKYREIESFDSVTGEEFRLVTNIFDMSAEDLLSLYKKRWSIELFFKWVKQHLTIKKWLGHSLNAISIQIYSALIVYILLLIIKNRLKLKLSIFNLLRKLRPNLLETFAFEQILLR